MNLLKTVQRMISILLAISFLTACGNSAPITKPVPVIPEDWETFTSSRYNYSIAYPTAWDLVSLDGEWENGTPLVRPYEAGFDSFTATDTEQSVSLVIGAQAIPDRTSLKKWATARTEEYVSQYGPWCGEPESRESVVLGGEPAIAMTHHCTDGLFLVYIYTVHGMQGFGMVWRSMQADEESDQAMFDQFLSSFAFTD